MVWLPQTYSLFDDAIFSGLFEAPEAPVRLDTTSDSDLVSVDRAVLNRVVGRTPSADVGIGPEPIHPIYPPSLSIVDLVPERHWLVNVRRQQKSETKSEPGNFTGCRDTGFWRGLSASFPAQSALALMDREA